jgi:hypothetical protein
MEGLSFQIHHFTCEKFMFFEDSSTVDISQTDEYLFPSQQESETTFRQELHKLLRENFG